MIDGVFFSLEITCYRLFCSPKGLVIGGGGVLVGGYRLLLSIDDQPDREWLTLGCPVNERSSACGICEDGLQSMVSINLIDLLAKGDSQKSLVGLLTLGSMWR